MPNDCTVISIQINFETLLVGFKLILTLMVPIGAPLDLTKFELALDGFNSTGF